MKYKKRLESFADAQEQYTGFLKSVLWKLTGDVELFSEAMQYSLLKMWQHAEKLQSKKAGAYIYRIALSAASQAWRNRSGRDGNCGLVHIVTVEESYRKVADTEILELTRRAISNLPVKQSRAIVMRYFEEKGYDILASELNCSEATARSHVSKAIRKLKLKIVK